MKQKNYTYRFAGGEISVMAFNEEEAKILAQAEAIKRGWDYKIILPRISHIDIHVDWSRLSPEEEKTLSDLLTKAQTNVIFETRKVK